MVILTTKRKQTISIHELKNKYMWGITWYVTWHDTKK